MVWHICHAVSRSNDGPQHICHWYFQWKKKRGAGNVSRQGDGKVLIIFAVAAEIIQVYAR